MTVRVVTPPRLPCPLSIKHYTLFFSNERYFLLILSWSFTTMASTIDNSNNSNPLAWLFESRTPNSSLVGDNNFITPVGDSMAITTPPPSTPPNPLHLLSLIFYFIYFSSSFHFMFFPKFIFLSLPLHLPPSPSTPLPALSLDPVPPSPPPPTGLQNAR